LQRLHLLFKFKLNLIYQIKCLLMHQKIVYPNVSQVQFLAAP
jgi:hypothetical protein